MSIKMTIFNVDEETIENKHDLLNKTKKIKMN